MLRFLWIPISAGAELWAILPALFYVGRSVSVFTFFSLWKLPLSRCLFSPFLPMTNCECLTGTERSQKRTQSISRWQGTFAPLPLWLCSREGTEVHKGRFALWGGIAGGTWSFLLLTRSSSLATATSRPEWSAALGSQRISLLGKAKKVFSPTWDSWTPCCPLSLTVGWGHVISSLPNRGTQPLHSALQGITHLGAPCALFKAVKSLTGRAGIAKICFVHPSAEYTLLAKYLLFVCKNIKFAVSALFSPLLPLCLFVFSEV